MSGITLNDLRVSLDAVDSAIINLLAERFRLSEHVGEFKKEHGLVAVDPAREASQFERIGKLALDAGLDPVIAKKFLRFIIDEVVARHNVIAGR